MTDDDMARTIERLERQLTTVRLQLRRTQVISAKRLNRAKNAEARCAELQEKLDECSLPTGSW